MGFSECGSCIFFSPSDVLYAPSAGTLSPTIQQLCFGSNYKRRRRSFREIFWIFVMFDIIIITGYIANRILSDLFFFSFSLPVHWLLSIHTILLLRGIKIAKVIIHARSAQILQRRPKMDSANIRAREMIPHNLLRVGGP